MIALLSLFQQMQVVVEFFLAAPRCAVDPRQHRIVGVAAPVGAGDLHQLEGVADLAGRSHMRPAAEIEPVALEIDLEILVFRDRVDQLDLVGLALLVKDLPRPAAVPHLLGEWAVALNDLTHLFLDDREVVGREGLVAGEIVIEAVLDHRTDRHLGPRPQLLHGLRQHMRGVVADEFQRAWVVAREDFYGAGPADRIGKVTHLSVKRVGDCLLRQRFGNRFGERGAACGGIVAARRTIGKCQGNLRHCLLLSSPANERGWD